MAEKTTPEDPKALPRLPLDGETMNVKRLLCVTGDQLFFGALLVELRLLNEKLDALTLALQTKGTKA